MGNVTYIHGGDYADPWNPHWLLDQAVEARNHLDPLKTDGWLARLTLLFDGGEGGSASADSGGTGNSGSGNSGSGNGGSGNGGIGAEDDDVHRLVAQAVAALYRRDGAERRRCLGRVLELLDAPSDLLEPTYAREAMLEAGFAKLMFVDTGQGLPGGSCDDHGYCYRYNPPARTEAQFVQQIASPDE